MDALSVEHIIEWKKIKQADIPDLVKMFERKIDKIKNSSLREEMAQVVKKTHERLKKWNMDGAMWAVHSIVLRYSLLEGVDLDDRMFCDQIYDELTAECDALYKKLFPDEFLWVELTRMEVGTLLDMEKTPQ